MTIKEIIDGLKFTVDMFLFDPITGETYKEPRNDMDKTTIDACNGAIELLEQTIWIPVSEKLPELADCYIVTRQIGSDLIVDACFFDGINTWHNDKWINHERNYVTNIVAWMPKPQPYMVESEG